MKVRKNACIISCNSLPECAHTAALSAREKIQKQVDEDLEPKLDMLLAKKVKPQAMRKEPVARKDQHFKFKTNEQRV